MIFSDGKKGIVVNESGLIIVQEEIFLSIKIVMGSCIPDLSALVLRAERNTLRGGLICSNTSSIQDAHAISSNELRRRKLSFLAVRMSFEISKYYCLDFAHHYQGQ